MKLHEKIRKTRKSKGVSQSFMAYHLKISVSGYSMKESGKRSINTEELEKIACLLNESPSFFLKINST